MGLTIHYKLRLPAAVTLAAAERLVRTAHRRAAGLVRRRELAEISPLMTPDRKSSLGCQFVLEKRGEDAVGHDVQPEAGWIFGVHPGSGCESAEFGLCLYPDTIRVGRRTLLTKCGGWGYAGSCKTQYASLHGTKHFLKCHRLVIDLLLIWERLGLNVTITDEGHYWPGRDDAKLLTEVTYMNRLVAAFGGALKDADDEGGLSVESPIFQHGQYELLEAQGMTQYGSRITPGVEAVRREGRI